MVQGTANVMVSLPHYMADGVNTMNAASVQVVTSGAYEVLDLSLVAIEQIAMFVSFHPPPFVFFDTDETPPHSQIHD